MGDLIAATPREAAREAERVAGAAPSDVVVTHPATWAALRRTTLTEAAVAAGLPEPRLLPEPVAAAAYFATGAGHRVGMGPIVVVYDLGGGTLDVSAVRRTPDGFEVVAVEGMPEFGGVDLDAEVVQLLRTAMGPAEWSRLSQPSTDAERRRSRQLWDDARAAKEALSRQPNTSVLLPSTGRDLQVGREEFWAVAAEPLAATAELTRTVIERADVDRERIAGLFRVGGSTRIPLVATTLHRATGMAPTVLEQPEIVVAEGALQATVSRVDDSADFIFPAAPGAPGPEDGTARPVPGGAPEPELEPLANGVAIDGAGTENGTLEGVGAEAAYAYREDTVGAYTNCTYNMGAVSGNLSLTILVTGLSSDEDVEREDFDTAVAALATQVIEVLPLR